MNSSVEGVARKGRPETRLFKNLENSMNSSVKGVV